MCRILSRNKNIFGGMPTRKSQPFQGEQQSAMVFWIQIATFHIDSVSSQWEKRQIPMVLEHLNLNKNGRTLGIHQLGVNFTSHC